MKGKNFKWLIAFLYLNLSLMIVFPLFFMLVQIGTEYFFSFNHGDEFSFSNIIFMKAIKAGVFCGVFSGSGCWWIYYQHHKKNRH